MLYQTYNRHYRRVANLTDKLKRQSVEVGAMLMRTDPFREFDRLAQQLVGRAPRRVPR